LQSQYPEPIKDNLKLVAEDLLVLVLVMELLLVQRLEPQEETLSISGGQEITILEDLFDLHGPKLVTLDLTQVSIIMSNSTLATNKEDLQEVPVLQEVHQTPMEEILKELLIPLECVLRLLLFPIGWTMDYGLSNGLGSVEVSL